VKEISATFPPEQVIAELAKQVVEVHGHLAVY